jgi:uncharacterized protein with FMN-binding domain
MSPVPHNSANGKEFFGQNVYLYCASRGLNTVVLGWVDKEGLGRAMRLKPSQQVILCQTVGYPPGKEPEPVTVPSNASLRDGRWQGTASGYVDDITVEVVVEAGAITDVEIISQRESAPGSSFKDIPARIVAEQRTDGVDAVSGATITSKAILDAAADALQKSSTGSP